MDHAKSLRLASAAAGLVALFLLAVDAGYLILFANPGPGWTSGQEFATRFREFLPGFAPIFAGLGLIPAYIFLSAAWHSLAEGADRVWTLSGAVFGLLFAALTGTGYLIQVLMVLPRGLAGQAAGLEMLAFANPHSVTWMMNIAGWFFQAVSMLCFAVVLGSSRLERIIRWLFLVHAATALLLVVGYALGSLALQAPIGLSWFVVQPAAYVLLARHFRRQAAACIPVVATGR